MNQMKKILGAMLVFVLVAAPEVNVRRIPSQDKTRGPTVSDPQTEIAPNGDRVSPYPPYFRPDRSGGRF